jgi:hypothetical protein
MTTSPTPRAQFWHQVLEDWKRSGLSITEFCRQRNLKTVTFHRWKSLFQKANPPASSTTTFLPITLVPETLVEIALPNGIVLKLPLAADPTLISQFLKAVTP